ncbi:MAG: dihydropteroate synthase [Hyphomonadaceae bacterium]|nr:dihydropteroate synthase [Hyphomonadaceae bacterium]
MPEHREIVRDAFLSRAAHGPLIMGILNVTPDSFSDGGQHFDPQQALARAMEMCSEGADILDVGGESTRPGASSVSQEEELARVESVIVAINQITEVPISIDTYKAGVARAAAAVGAVIVNDVWGMTCDSEMAQAVADTQCAIVVTYNRGKADGTINLVDDMKAFFDRAFATAHTSGIPREHVILDPGLGFAKTYEQNFEALARLDVLQEYKLPILVGVSRKSFIGRLLDKPVNQRLAGTLAANLAALRSGASIVRVHDIAAHREALAVLGAIEAHA